MDCTITDDLIDASLMEAATVDDLERQLELRRVAQKAFVEHNAKATIQKVRNTQSRVAQEFVPGDYIYVYRVPRQRKRRVGGTDFIDRATAKPYWVGPGTTITVDGANLWISMFGELWKTAKEQCRVATNVEKQGIEIILEDCRELIEEYRKNANRAGYKDLTEEPRPNEEAEEESGAHGEKRRMDLPEEEPSTKNPG